MKLHSLCSKFKRLLSTERGVVETDVLVVGGGPAGLSTAIRIKQLAPSIRVILLEKGSAIGSHIVSGAVMETRALDELFVDWKTSFADDPAPLDTPALKDRMYFLTKNAKIRLPIPSLMENHGNYIVSLNDFTRWLGRRAEEAQVELYPGFGGANLIIEDEMVKGVITNDVGIGKDGHQKSNYEPGMEIRAKVTVLAEGAHGSLTKQAKRIFNLQEGKCQQTYGLGLKEVWQVPEEQHQPGLVVHSIGWPLDEDTYGGAFAYHYGKQNVSIGLVIGLDYRNPYLNPYEEFQRIKLHPLFRRMLQGGKCLTYGARVINEGGIQCIPKLTFPGGLLVGCSAGFVNVPKIKGSHYAMKSSMLAAETIINHLRDNEPIQKYEDNLRSSWIWEDLWKVRNLRPAFQRYGLIGGLIYSGIDTMLLRGRTPWTLEFNRTDHDSLYHANDVTPIEYPEPDNKLTFDLMTSVSRTGVNHEDDQPSHLQLTTPHLTTLHANLYAEVESRFCPAGVYEYVEGEEGLEFKINAQNCIHCKTCDIKDPSQSINWTVPEGGGGPNYSGM